ncbi:unnamed protein product [Clonostachys byssicola]|uniref:Heterokaryon incompatibility domain-containing protein n=1 Tax=Clonostachys byssicola TaxID=160290 RepID=A0A9N9UAW5_9HYPO|nr:unnamed protein product [Clonostachys byssicola]
MGNSKICRSCLEHFTFARPDVIEVIKDLKKESVQLAVEAGYGDDDLKSLQEDVKDYEADTTSLPAGSYAPYPWASGLSVPQLWMYPQIWIDEHSRFLGQLRESVKSSGCHICRSLCKLIAYAAGDDVSDSAKITTSLCCDSAGKEPLRLQFAVQTDQSSQDGSYVAMGSLECRRIGFFNSMADLSIQDEEPFDSLPSTDSSVEFLSRNLDSCLKNHPECSSRQTTGWVPTRLLEVRSADDDNDCVFLVERDNIQAPGGGKPRYLTLSHIWGSSKPLCLTRDNYDSLKSGMKTQELPQCYRDAVFLARKLGISHVWIDSLCIIQDSSEDWEREAMTMDKVFTNGICNIAACDGTGSSDSLFSDPNSIPHPKTSFKVKYTNGVVEFEVVPIWMDLMRKYSPLSKRAWYVQEKFLSTRIMHLTKIPLWECRKSVIAEGCSEPVTYPLTKSSASERDLMWSDEQDINFNLARWRKIVEFYCQCKLTFPMDKLVAIGGLAKAFSSLLKEDYCAGVWGGELLVPCLLWRTFHPSMPSTEYLAPSWSWACRNGPMVQSRGVVSKVFVRDASFQAVPKSSDIFGQLILAELRLTGRPLEISDFTTWRQRTRYKIQSTFDREPHVESDKQVYFLPLAKLSFVYSQGEKAASIEGLFVQVASQRPGKGATVFKRVGFGQTREGEDGGTNRYPRYDENWDYVFDTPLSELEKDLETIILV